VIEEPVGGAHRHPDEAIDAAGDAIERTLSALDNLPPDEVRRQRREKYLAIGRSL
jgi:acetyl-CoA carboxylase carboxyl transferase subunit alpha